jgi:hypothetical protein
VRLCVSAGEGFVAAAIVDDVTDEFGGGASPDATQAGGIGVGFDEVVVSRRGQA